MKIMTKLWFCLHDCESLPAPIFWILQPEPLRKNLVYSWGDRESHTVKEQETVWQCYKEKPRPSAGELGEGHLSKWLRQIKMFFVFKKKNAEWDTAQLAKPSSADIGAIIIYELYFKTSLKLRA